MVNIIYNIVQYGGTGRVAGGGNDHFCHFRNITDDFIEVTAFPDMGNGRAVGGKRDVRHMISQVDFFFDIQV